MTDPKTIRVLVSEPLSEAGLDELRAHFDVDYRPECTDAELGGALEAAQALIVRSKTRVTAPRIRAARSLRVIGRAGVGYDNIDLDAATERGILVMNVPDANTMAATEHTFALMLALARRIPQAVQTMREQKWKRSDLVGHELYEKTLGVVGFGRIGKEIAHRAQAFGMSVLVFDPYVTEEKATALGVGLASLDALLARSDFMTLHVPLTDATRKLIGREQLARMKPTAFLINCARGGIIDDEALAEALAQRRISGAALDVYVTEPPDFSAPLLAGNLPNLICTPHLGASTEEAQEKVGTSIARQVTSALVNEEFANSVNLPVIDPVELAKLRPFMRLAERMAVFLARWLETRVGQLELVCEGEVARLDTGYVQRAALKGFLSCCLEGPVTYVNAPKLAEQRGLKLMQSLKAGGGAWTSRITLANRTDSGCQFLAGSVTTAGEPRLTSVNDFEIDMSLEGKILLFFHHDQPGVIGRVGTILGNSKVNIGRMEVGRKGQGEDAIMVLSVDSEVDDRVLANLRELDEIRDVRMIGL